MIPGQVGFFTSKTKKKTAARMNPNGGLPAKNGRLDP
jgi:hypothetical protein